MNKMYLVLGDWSQDGHNMFDKVLVNVNKTVSEVQQAYKKSCELTGIQFNHKENYTGGKRDSQVAEIYRIATEYEDSYVNETCSKILESHGVDISFLDEDRSLSKEDYVKLWFEFVKLSLPDLEYESPNNDDGIPVINGFWNDDLNSQFGYGLYHD